MADSAITRPDSLTLLNMSDKLIEVITEFANVHSHEDFEAGPVLMSFLIGCCKHWYTHGVCELCGVELEENKEND